MGKYTDRGIYREDGPPHIEPEMFEGRTQLQGNIIGRWPLKVGEGIQAYDVGKNNITGVINGTVNWVDDSKKGIVLDFDGSSTYIDLGDDSVFSPSSAITFGAWVKPDSIYRYSVINKGVGIDSADSEYALIVRDDNTVDAYIYDETSGTQNNVESTIALSTGNWYHLMATWDGSTIKIYINGVQYGSASFSDTIRDGTNPLIVGYREPRGDNYVDGKISDVRLYSRALTQAEINGLIWSESPNAIGHKLTATNRTVSNDGMTANPETDTEDGFVEVEIEGTTYQIPVYTS